MTAVTTLRIGQPSHYYGKSEKRAKALSALFALPHTNDKQIQLTGSKVPPQFRALEFLSDVFATEDCYATRAAGKVRDGNINQTGKVVFLSEKNLDRRDPFNVSSLGPFSHSRRSMS
jgi:hypothetical protein